MKGKVVGDKFLYNNMEFKMSKRQAVEGEYVVTTPDSLDWERVRSEYDIPFYTPFCVISATNKFVMIPAKSDNPHDWRHRFLYTGEYFVLTELRKERIKVAEEKIVKKLLGITIYSKTIYTYEYR